MDPGNKLFARQINNIKTSKFAHALNPGIKVSQDISDWTEYDDKMKRDDMKLPTVIFKEK